MQHTVRYVLNGIIDLLEISYGRVEATAIARRLLEDGYNITRKDVLLNPDMTISDAENESLQARVKELISMRPIQYVVGKQEFLGREFWVDESVLIPRPETEELVVLIAKECGGAKKILDIGTGSGAIAISLALEIPETEVYAWDISENALSVAARNANKLGAEVKFQRVDITQQAEDSHQANLARQAMDLCNVSIAVEGEQSEKWDVIVSNPPYVTESEKTQMKSNVLDFEPHIALFVKDEDPLKFYRIIANFASQNLKPKGKLYFEINQQFGAETAKLLEPDFENIRVIRDLFGVDRIISCNLK